jgi:hypothetical protein
MGTLFKKGKTAGLFNRIRNKQTRRRFLISTIRKDGHTFETAVFAANFLYLPYGFTLKNPLLLVQCSSHEEADKIHHTLTKRLQKEYPPRVFQEYS